MDNVSYSNDTMASAGLPYDNIKWYDIQGQPFGPASGFNAIILNDANNIIDFEGPVAIGGDFYSQRGLSVGFTRDNSYREIGYSPDLVRFLVGGKVSMSGPLVVVGHVVGGSGFRAAPGSTYLIGKDDKTNGIQELNFLYQAKGGSQYWSPTDKGDHYLVPSYDVPRYIPASRIAADIPKFFADARESIAYYKNCIEALTPNGTVVDNSYEWILKGNDPVQNVFLIDVSPNGLISKGIRAEVPQGSTVIVRLRTGVNAHLQYGVYGEKSKADRTLYVFEDASNIYMEKSSDIWGSILAPQAMFHAHPTGGHVSGNAALGSFAVNAASGFEFHYYPFVGGLVCQTNVPTPAAPAPQAPTIPPESPAPVPEAPAPAPEIPEVSPSVPEAPAPIPEVPEVSPSATIPPAPVCPECPTCPEATPCPEPVPCPTCPEATPCPEPVPCPTCPEPTPCPTCPEATPCPEAVPCPTCPEPTPCPTCPEAIPCPELVPCPTCPECPEAKPCPECPKAETEYIPVPIPIPVRCPEPEPCPVCEDCLIQQGIIKGYIQGSSCGKSHQWIVRLYKRYSDMDTLLCTEWICGCGQFEFEVPYQGYYILKVRSCDKFCKVCSCKPIITLKNVGVSSFTME